MSVKSNHSSTKKEKIIKKEKKKKAEDSDEDNESSEEELDLTKECHPIGYYMNDRPEMISQMFSVIKGNKLRAMLPPILKDFDVEQLKLQCLDQLLGMSEKRISCILEGETLETSSESEVAESDECDSEEKNGSTSGSSSDRSDDSQDGRYTRSTGSKQKKRKGDTVSEGKSGKLSKTEYEPPEQGKTLLEILELEMRARAIRALLKQSGSEKGNDQTADEPKPEDSEIKENAGEVVDLTECEDERAPSVKKDTAEEEVYKRVWECEEKIEKSKKLQAELEFRNKLYKKKIYRTRQQRMENDECEKPVGSVSESVEVVIKQEPIDMEEIVVEDPEEGEVSTSEDEYPVEIKKEVIEPEVEETLPKKPEEPPEYERKIDKDAERITAIDNGMFESNSNMMNNPDNEQETVEQPEVASAEEESRTSTKESTQGEIKVSEADVAVEETSWRDRWLKKDEMQKLVKSSKIYAKVKKRIAEKTQKAKEEVPSSNEANSEGSCNAKMEVIEGSIEEYEKLLKKAQGESELLMKGNPQQSKSTSDGDKGDNEESLPEATKT